MDAGPIKDSYTLDYTWAPDGRSVSWTWSRGRSSGRRTARTCSSGSAGPTTVTYSLAVDLNIPMIGMLRRKAEKVIIDTALKGLKRRVESHSGGRTEQAVTSVRARRAVHRQGRRRQDDARRGHGRPPRPSGRKALVVSTDPAHSLGDALEAELDGEPTELESGLYAAHIDTHALLDDAWGPLQRHLRTVLAGAGVDELVADELTVLPGVEDLLALARGAARRRVGAVGGRRRRLRAHRGDAAVAGPARSAGGLPRAAVPRAPAGGARAVGGPVRRRAGRRGGLGFHDRRPRRAGRAARGPPRDARRPHPHLDPARAHPGAGGGGGDPAHAHRVGAARAARRRRRRQPGRAGAAAVAARARGALAARAAHRAAGRARRADRAGGCRCPTVDHTAAEPTGVAALLEVADDLYGATDPAAAGSAGPPPLRVRRTRGGGHVGGLGVRAGDRPARRGRRSARAGPRRRRAGGRGRRGAAAGGAAVGAAPVHGHRGAAGRRRPVRRVRPRPAVWTR